MMEMQNQYDEGWYDGVEFGLTMKDVNEGILPQDNERVLVLVNGEYIKSTFYPIWFQENGINHCRRVFLQPDGQSYYVPGFIRYWMPMPRLPVSYN